MANSIRVNREVITRLADGVEAKAKLYRMLDGYVFPTADPNQVAKAVGRIAYEDGYRAALQRVSLILDYYESHEKRVRRKRHAKRIRLKRTDV